ncbi:MAG: hypothetical protein H6729_05515 [Deltaproteobacteria bacterium]|nr:hypothetical protein [Deltaproteobacteria bacterium]
MERAPSSPTGADVRAYSESEAEANSGSGVRRDADLAGAAVASKCMRSPAAAIHRAALGLCGDLTLVGGLVVGSPDAPGDVEVSGKTSVNSAEIYGSLFANHGFRSTGATRVGVDLNTIEDVVWTGELDVGRDLRVGGAVDGTGSLEVGGTLWHSGDRNVRGTESIAHVEAFAAYRPSPECTSGFDVASTVQDASADAFDLDAMIADVAPGSAELVLKTGNYFLNEKREFLGHTRISIEGHVSLMVSGDLRVIGDGAFVLADGATLDLYVAGRLTAVGSVSFEGSPAPSSVRIYVGGEGDTVIGVGSQRFFGTLYAPFGRIDWVGDTRVEGAIFANALMGTGNLEIIDARPMASDDDGCSSEDPPGHDAGSSPTSPPESNRESDPDSGSAGSGTESSDSSGGPSGV